ncbi:DUF1015 domain-containing protein [Sinomicrobium weinanense]|uniref:DUF1015 domain-containing protein n=1 Tax=Sinomicrobium weinanense TaxID=2842200 RepID=A0A926JV70_9FLAO|nr:DUF1015 domain-containing protein [Sinomicrobium weinanense]MBC9797766.1 DUF1015 domain-containing protein [Sinomicrobium weinanense]MBU3122415.1 DUF1015 domain-containing protein [Sinomicrobium weinanense]
MATIQPFKAVRPTKDKVGLVASRSYESYSRKERESRLKYNPFSFLHIVNPGYKYHREVSGENRFKLVRNRYLEFREDHIFIQDETPSLYIYKQKTRKHTFCGILGGASAGDYRNNIIKKHEATIQSREELFMEYLKTVGFNTEPVLLTYPDNNLIENIITDITSTIPEYEFTTTDRITHFLWKLSDPEKIAVVQKEFEQIGDIYIADGHHRSASSCLLADNLKTENPGHTGKEAYNYFMSYFIPESDLRIYEFNRMIKGLNGLSKEDFLIRLDEWYRIENRGEELYRPSKKHHFTMYLDGEFYSLYLRKTIYDFSAPLSTLDTQILYKTILEPILGIGDLRNDGRIAYGCGKDNVVEMKSLIDKNKYDVGFGMLPVTIDEIKKIADEGLQMPPKSTYIEPKLRSGMTIYEF